MKIFKTTLFLLTILSLNISADINATKNSQNNYIDKVHGAISGKVIDYSNDIDTMLRSMMGSSEQNKTTPRFNDQGERIDTFFHNDKFVEETANTFVSVGLDYVINSNSYKKFNMTINARLPLSKSTKKYNLFINDLTKDNVDNALNMASDKKESRAEIGINYFTTFYRDIESKYSIGTNGLNPFAIARYTLNYNYKKWKIEPTQKFRYSLKDNFVENTNLYFDRPITDTNLFRIVLSRSTSENSSGMSYALSVQDYLTYPNKIGVLLSQSFSGNTKYEYSTNNPALPLETKKDGGITSYTTAINFRQNIWRKWFFYSVSPSLNFNKANRYEALYSIDFFMQFYFGHLK